MDVSVAPPAFHARFSALRRHYTYKILDANQVISPLHRFDVASWYRPLDIEAMNTASALLLGDHDFAAYCKFREGATTIRQLQKFEWLRDSEGYLVGDVVADAFCYSMVRNLVGAVVCVADGRFGPEWIAQTLANKVRISDSLVFPACGLTLRQVDYPSDAELLDRAAQTVARREAPDQE
jgi:tRNA pseudouridine38-40 synthase